MSEPENLQMDSEASGSDGENSEDRMGILSQIESGQIDVEEGLRRLEEAESDDDEQEDLLGQLEAGEIDVSEAIRLIESGSSVGGASAPASEVHEMPSISPSLEKLRSWWLLIPAIGLVVTAFGGWMSTYGGWWWLFAAPSLLGGILILLFGLATYNSPWLHIRVDTGQVAWPQRVSISFPIPIRLASWGLRKWGHYAGSLDATAIDELLLSLEENFSADNPIHIEVHEDKESGEKIQVFLG